MVPVAPIITGITAVFTVHIRSISIVRSLYYSYYELETKDAGWGTMEGRSRRGQVSRWKKNKKKNKKKKNQLDIPVISLIGIYN